MSVAHVALGMLLLFITAIFLGFPIAFTLLALAFIFGWYAMDERIVSLIATNSADVMTNDTLVAVPLFLFMGYMVERANILDRLFRSIQVAARGVPASLAVAALVTCALFATRTNGRCTRQNRGSSQCCCDACERAPRSRFDLSATMPERRFAT